MKNVIKKCLILVIVSLCFTLTLSLTYTSIFAATVIPTDYTTIYTSTNNDITDEMDNNFGVFKFTNYGARFIKVTLTATSTQNVMYPNGSISVKNSDYQLVEKLDISGFNSYAINSENSNYLYVFLETNGSYYVEVNYNMTNITKLELNISAVNSTTSLNNFNYSESEEFVTSFINDSSSVEEIKQFTIKQATQFNLNVLLNNEQSSGVRIIIVKVNSIKSEELIETKVNQLVYDDYSTYIDLIEGTYYIGYFGLLSNNEIDISLTRNITAYGSSVLVPDPDYATNCGSQITLEESDIIWYNRSYRQNNITEGFTRFIYLDSSAPSLSRLDYYWYSSDEDVAIITDYGTVLALPINTSQETVKVMAVYKNDMSKCYVKEFVVKNDTSTYSSDPINIYIDMTIETLKYTSIDLSSANVPVNILQYYTWKSADNVTVDGWGRLFANIDADRTNVTIVGTYNYNPKVKIKVYVTVHNIIDVRLFAVNEYNIPRDSYFEQTSTIISSVRTNEIQTNFYTSISDNDMILALDSTKLFFIHTHGYQNGIYTGTGWIESSELVSVDLSNLELALLMTCNTGDGGYNQGNVDSNNPINIVERMICCGAETVVGFNDTTYVKDCNLFAPDFAEQTMINRLSVADAIDSIDYTGYMKDMSSIAVIGGNLDNTIWN